MHDCAGASITVVLDPVDGSTNCARDISYWATSICALDGDGALAALVVNHASGTRTTAIRGAGTERDGRRVHASGEGARIQLDNEAAPGRMSVTPRRRMRSPAARSGRSSTAAATAPSTAFISIVAKAAPAHRRVPPPKGSHENGSGARVQLVVAPRE